MKVLEKMIYVEISVRLAVNDFYLRHIKKPRCALCGQVATLQNSNGSWICEQCAQSMSDY